MEDKIKSVKIESTVCGRCGGTGKYSFNMMHGSTCYGCSGAGRVLTKRGAAASKFLNALRNVPVETLKVGDFMQEYVGTGGSRAFFKVEKIDVMPAKDAGYRDNDGTVVKLELSNAKAGDCTTIKFTGNLVRKGFRESEKNAQLKLALEYQDTLTKIGKPMKSKGVTNA